MPAKVNLAPATRPPEWWREHGPILGVLAVAACLLFVGLGRNYLWADEGDTAVLARNILTFGVPTGWDGVSLTDSDYGTRLTGNFVMVSHPWLPYYLTAASFAVLGETPLAARLPFALAGLATIGLVYLMVLRLTRNWWAALSASILLTLSVQFLIYARQSRYYALTAALTCLLVWLFARLNSWRQALAFALVATLLFHSHPMGLAAVGALGVLTLIYRPYRPQRAWFWRAAPIIAALTAPWLMLSRGGFAYNTVPLGGVVSFAGRLGQFAIECASVTPLLGTTVLLLVLAWAARRAPGSRQGAGRIAPHVLDASERPLAVALTAVIAAFGIAVAFSQSREMIWIAGVRYTTAVIPFGAILAGLAIAQAGRDRRWVWAALIVLFGFTKFGRITPWVFFEPPTATRDEAALVTFHNPERPVDRILRTSQVAFARSLVRPNQGTIAGVIDYLKAHAGPNDVVITNYGWEALYFHTRLPLGMTVLPSYPIWDAVQAHGLPPYVSSDQGARWVVWRRAWGNYRGQDCEQILTDLHDRGATLTAVASVPETVWENRENVHFRRFTGNRYLYSWFDDLPPALIIRVDWPGSGAPSATPR